MAPLLTKENAKTILPQVIGKPMREVERVIHQHFPERALKKETFEVELDDELKNLLERAKQIASEKNSTLLLKKVLKAYVREKRPRKTHVLGGSSKDLSNLRTLCKAHNLDPAHKNKL